MTGLVGIGFPFTVEVAFNNDLLQLKTAPVEMPWLALRNRNISCTKRSGTRQIHLLETFHFRSSCERLIFVPI